MLPRLIHTVSFRLTLIAAGIFSICVMALGAIVFFDMRESLEEQLRQRVRAEVSQLLVDYQQDGLDELRHDIRERVEADSIGRLLYFIQGPNGKVIFDRLDTVPQQEGWHRPERNGDAVLLYAVPLDDGYWFAVAADMREVRVAERAVLHASGLAFAAMLLLSLLSGAWVSRVFLRQVDKIAQAAARIGDGNLAERLPSRGTDDDLDRLAIIINRMLDRIQRLVEDVHHVSASIAHDLRTPLSHVRQILERMKQQDNMQDDALLNEALRELDGLLETFSALLRIAEIESGTRRAGFRQLHLSALLIRLAETYAPVLEEAGQTLSTEIEPNITLSGDAELLTQLFVNLIENAIHHAGKDSTVTLFLLRDGKTFTAGVRDNGPGIPPEMLDEVVKPFYRLDHSRSTPGSGLGLSLVIAIADLHSFKLTLIPTNPGMEIYVSGDTSIGFHTHSNKEPGMPGSSLCGQCQFTLKLPSG